MRNKGLVTIVVLLGALVILGLLWGDNASAGPPLQGPGGDETQAGMDSGFWYQGRLTDGDGNPLTNANVAVGFRLYDVGFGGTPLGVTTITVNTDGSGLFNEEIDFYRPDLFDGRALFLGLQVDGDAEMTPRQYLRPVPYALNIRPGAVISPTNWLDPVLVIRNNFSSTSDLDGLLVYTKSAGEAVEGRSKYGKGVYGATEADGTVAEAGLYGEAFNSAPGVRGRSQGTNTSKSYGGYFTSVNRRGLYAEGGAGFYAGYFQGNDPSGPGIYVYGDIYATGDLQAGGTKPAVVQAGDYGPRELYAVESPNVWFEDFGQGQLVSGQATVTIEPMFRSTINAEVPYHVFLTPLGDCNGLYVTNKTATSFEVRELGGGTANVAFDYRIVALRKGYEGVRMEVPMGESGKPLEVAPPAPSKAPEPEKPRAEEE